MPLRLVEKNGITLLVSTLLESANVRHAFTTRRGGVSTGDFASLNLRISCADTRENVYKNYEILADALDFEMRNVVMSHQVHSNFVRRADAGEGLFAPDRPNADGLISDRDDLALFVFSADCVPILLADRAGGAVAAVHAGWRGTALGILGEAVRRMTEEYGTDPANVVAAIGPHISQASFEVGGEVADAMRLHFGEEADEFMYKRGEKFFPDLGLLNREELLRAGVLPENIDLDTHCTLLEPELFWSHRRTGDARGVQGAVVLSGGSR